MSRHQSPSRSECLSSQQFNSVQHLNGFNTSASGHSHGMNHGINTSNQISNNRGYNMGISHSASKYNNNIDTDVGISKEVDDLKSTLTRIQSNVSNNNSFEKENSQINNGNNNNGNNRNNGNMILGGLKEKLHNKNEYKADLPQFPMKYKK